MKGVKLLFSIVWKTVKAVFIVFCIFIGLLFFREVRLPNWAVDKLQRVASQGNFVVACDEICFSLRSGFRFKRLKVFDTSSKRGTEPMLSAKSVEVDPVAFEVSAVELKFPRLYDDYYVESEPVEKNCSSKFLFPNLPSFTLELVRPYVLGVAPESVTCQVDTSRKHMSFSNIQLIWPDDGEKMELDGRCEINLNSQIIKGEVKGLARQSHIRPLLEALDVPSALPYFDAFTEVTEPVPAYCGWEVNLVNNDFWLNLDLKPTMGRYNGVPMSRVDGKVGLHIYARDNHLNYDTTIGPLKAWNPDGELMLSGGVTVHCTNAVKMVEMSAEGNALPKELTTIIDYLNGGSLEVLSTTNALRAKVDGWLAVEVERQAANALKGQLSSPGGRFLEVPYYDATTDFSYYGDTIWFSNLQARGEQNGLITGTAILHVPGLDEERDSYEVEMNYACDTLGEIVDAFGFNLSDRTGKIKSALKMTAPLASNQLESIVAQGRIEINEAMLWRLKFFDQLTTALHINKLPGAGLIAGLSDSASGDFVISNGVLRTENAVVEGPLLSIKAWGSYNLLTDELDFIVRMQPLRKSASGDLLPIGDVVHFITQPLTRPLEYRLTGTPAEPKWNSRWVEYIIDKVKNPL